VQDRGWQWLARAPPTTRDAYLPEQPYRYPQSVDLNVQTFREPETVRSAVNVDIRVAEFNVCSLSYRKGENRNVGLDGPNRAAVLSGQLHEAMAAIAGLIETRLPTDQRPTEHYWIVSAGPTAARVGGAEIWLARLLPHACNHRQQNAVLPAPPLYRRVLPGHLGC